MDRKGWIDIPWAELRSFTADRGATPQTLDHLDEFISRRRFLGQTGALAALMGLGAGTDAAMRGLFGRGLIPSAWAADEKQQIAGKPGMTVHNTRPVNGEFAPHLLSDDVTPTERHFVRNNGLVPKAATDKNAQGWKLKIEGEVNQPVTLTLDELRKMPSVTMPLLIECGGNGRANFDPNVRGNPWDRGAIGCSEWTGVRMRDVLERAGLKSSAVYTAHYGADPAIGNAEPFSRGVPIDKAMEEHTIIAYQMNGKDLAPLNGFPLRIVVPGWIGSASQKWLTRIWIRDQVHDSEKMSGYSYRVPAYPVIPGSRPPEKDMVIATAWIVKSMITNPAPKTKLQPGGTVKVRGHAWAGENKIDHVVISTDYGRSWEKTTLKQPPNKYAWYAFEAETGFPKKGYYEIWARAFDEHGTAQPFQQPWNPKGYLGNVIHRVPVHVGI